MQAVIAFGELCTVEGHIARCPDDQLQVLFSGIPNVLHNLTCSVYMALQSQVSAAASEVFSESCGGSEAPSNGSKKRASNVRSTSVVSPVPARVHGLSHAATPPTQKQAHWTGAATAME